MLLDYTYLLTDFDASFFNDVNTQKSEFIFPINEQITRNTAEMFQTLLKSESHFCFYIPFELTGHSHKFKEETFRNIVRLLFLPNYLRVDHKIVFFTEKVSVDKNHFEGLKNELYVELRKQGINGFIVEELKPRPSSQNEPGENSISLYDDDLNNYLNGTEEECFQTFVNSPAFAQNFYKKWIVPVSDQDNFRSKIKLLEKFENWIWHAHPFSAKLIAMDKQARRNNTKLKSDNEILRFKLESSAEALKLIREEFARDISELPMLRNEINRLSQQIVNPTAYLSEELILQLRAQINEEHNRADEILKWYKKEYEILPVWYKKFGHIIKVIAGKRTFKSLFNNKSNDQGRKNT